MTSNIAEKIIANRNKEATLDNVFNKAININDMTIECLKFNKNYLPENVIETLQNIMIDSFKIAQWVSILDTQD